MRVHSTIGPTKALSGSITAPTNGSFDNTKQKNVEERQVTAEQDEVVTHMDGGHVGHVAEDDCELEEPGHGNRYPASDTHTDPEATEGEWQAAAHAEASMETSTEKGHMRPGHEEIIETGRLEGCCR